MSQNLSAKAYLEAANAVVPRISAEEGIAVHKNGGAVFIDVRDSSDIAKTGTIAGAHRIPRGFIEFAADETTDFHNSALSKDAEILIVCAAGGMAALAGKTLNDMGYQNVRNVGGITDWIGAGGDIEE
ncbi:MAG: rhodanese-like domain-containing protein [Bacteroidetes bacterium]|jgi:rhodanese-related sulfurtransferase|nr:rhodanese-like domain-containing protein [Bacteroidota bacterium]